MAATCFRIGQRCLVAAALCAAPAVRVLAAGPALSEGDYFASMPVVISVTRLPQKRSEIPASVTVIDHDMIVASGVQSIPDLFRLVAGFQVGHVDGTRTTVTYHGLADEYARRMQVLVDGRSVYMPGTGGVDWQDLPLAIEDIDRIEVTRGPNGASYGANAFLGVINIITYHPDQVRGTLFKSQFQFDGGYQRVMVRHAGRRGNFAYRVSVVHDQLPGFNDSEQQVDDLQNSFITFRGDYRPSVNDYLTMELGYNQGPRGAGYVGNLTDPARHNELRRHYEMLNWRRELDSDDGFDVRFSHTVSNINATYQTADLSTIFGTSPASIQTLLGQPDQALSVDQGMRSERYDIGFTHHLRLAPHLRAVWGSEARLDRVEAAGYLGATSGRDRVDEHLYRLFFNAEWRPEPKWVVNGGAMFEHNSIATPPPAPRLAVNYVYRPHQSVRLSWTRAYRTPAILEQYGDYGVKLANGQVLDLLWHSNQNLTPERIRSPELGWRGESGNGALSYDFTVFRQRLDNLIATPTDHNYPEPYSSLCGVSSAYSQFCQVLRFENGGEATLRGAELQVKVQPDPRTFLSLALSHAVARGQLLTDLNPSTTLDIRDATPVDTLGVLFSHRTPHDTQFSVGYYSVDPMKFLGARANPGVQTMDVRLAQGFRLPGMHGEVALTLRDILGSYYDFSYWNLAQRRALVTVAFKF